ncbi:MULTISPECIES: hypothetical protein [Salinibaculum]
MAVIGATLFAVILWGAILGVALVFAYEVYVIASERRAVETT